MRGLLGAACALLLAALGGGGADAHAVLLETSPAAGTVLAEAPERIVLRFNEPVRPVVVQILRMGEDAPLGLERVRVIDTELHAPLPDRLGEGAYLVSYRVTSADGHPVAGSFAFAVGDAVAAPAAVDLLIASHDGFWRLVGVAARALRYGTLLLAAGLALFRALIPVPQELARPLARALLGLALAGIAAGIIMLGATGGALVGGPPGVLLSATPWLLAVRSPVAVSVTIALAGLGLLTLTRHGTTPAQRLALLAGGVLVALSFAGSGHAATAAPRWLTMPAVGLHALCAAFWLGALGPLLLALRRATRQDALDLLRAFSSKAVPVVGCLLLSGITLAVVQVETPAALITTDYGRRLVLKLVLVALLLGLAAVNRLVLTPALERRPGAARWLRSTIGVDLMLATGVVVLTASLGAVPPPRALAEQAAIHGHHRPDYAVHVTVRAHHLVLVATPSRLGANRFDLFVADDRNRPVVAKSAGLSMSLPEQGIEPLRLAAEAVEPGHYRGEATLPLPGPWQVDADLLIDEFTKLTFRTRIVVEK